MYIGFRTHCIKRLYMFLLHKIYVSSSLNNETLWYILSIVQQVSLTTYPDTLESEDIKKKSISIIKIGKNKKAPGEDTITNEAIKYLLSAVIKRLMAQANAILRTAHYPSIWKTTVMIVSCKPEKDSKLLQSHLPISLL